MKRYKFICLVLGFTSQAASSQTQIDRYIEVGLRDNQSIKQQEFLLDKSLYALKEAKTLFLPNVNFNSSYTLAGGGRTVDIPVGDLLNGAYKSLNQLTGSSAFPQLENQRILLNPNNFYDAKFHTTFPIINAEIGYNKKIKEKQFDQQKIQIDIYKRELVKEIKIAYYKYLQATEAIKVYESALKLVKENLRINTSLFNNDKVNRNTVIRSDNEVTKISSRIETARQEQNTARSYFNFLINRSLNEEILSDSINSTPAYASISDTAVTKREEFLSLKIARDITDNTIGLAKANNKPKLNSFLDVGAQGFDFKVNNRAPYYFFGVSLEWNVFSAGKNKYKIKQAETDRSILESQTSYVEQQLTLQLNTATNAFNSALSQYKAAQSQVASSQKYYTDMLKLYKEGTALFIELLDAQDQLVSAQLQSNISLFDTWAKYAEIERANAGFTIK